MCETEPCVSPKTVKTLSILTAKLVNIKAQLYELSKSKDAETNEEFKDLLTDVIEDLSRVIDSINNYLRDIVK